MEQSNCILILKGHYVNVNGKQLHKTSAIFPLKLRNMGLGTT